MKKSNTALAIAISLLLTGNSFATAEITTSKIEEVSTSAVEVQASNPSVIWENFLSSHGLHEGWNALRSGNIFITKGEATVSAGVNSRNFIASRNKAFESAMLFAKENMSSSLASSVSLKVLFESQDVNQDRPPAIQDAAAEASIMSKMHTLTSEALDAQIRKYDSSWNSNEMTDEQIQAKIVETREKFQKSISSKTSLWLQGASTLFNTEGPDTDGMYSVVVGLAWSENYANIVASIVDPSKPAQMGKPADTILNQIDRNIATDPSWLSKQQGIRVMRNETGERALVSFYNVERKGAKYRYQNTAKDSARSQIIGFVSSKLASNHLLNQAQTSDYNDDGTINAYNQDAFTARVSLEAKKVNLNGASVVRNWNGNHPIMTDKKLYGTVMVWSPSSRDKAVNTLEIVNKAYTVGGKKAKTTIEKNQHKSTGKTSVGGFGSYGFSLDDF